MVILPFFLSFHLLPIIISLILYLFSFGGIFLFNQEALNIVQISKKDQERVFAVLAAVLWLGNISFRVIDNGNRVDVLADEGNPYFLGFLIF